MTNPTKSRKEAGFDPAALARPEVTALKPYASARRIMKAEGLEGEVWLNANESPEAEDLAPLTMNFNRYPEAQPEAVVERYAAYAGLSSEQVLVTRGGDEAIELLVRTFCRPGTDAVLEFPPTYGMYAVSARTNGVGVVDLPTDPSTGWTPDADRIAALLDERPDVKVVFACSPGNPTGASIPRAVTERLAAATAGRALLVVDEAYVEFAPEASVVDMLGTHPHLVVIRTLSKAFALAGLRCGFVLADPSVIGLLLKVIAPYPIPTPTAQIAAQVLAENGIARMHARVGRIIAAREALAEGLSALPGVEAVMPSETNFLLVRMRDAEGVFNALVRRGIIVRDQRSQPSLDDAIRISVGLPEENARLLAAMADIMGDRR